MRILYEYASPAVGGRHVVCVMPMAHDAGQVLQGGTLQIEPVPADRLDRLDFFGNQVTEFSFRGACDRVTLTLQARVDRLDSGLSDSGLSDSGLPDSGLPDLGLQKPGLQQPGLLESVAAPLGQARTACVLADLPEALALCREMGPASPLHFLSPSFRVPVDAAMTAFARALVHRAMPVDAVVLTVGRALFRHMRFDPKATTVDTPAAEAFASRKGVCQDFSHIMIACLRGIGVPAGYVSGYLRTLPPPGKPRLEGADAMHAWVRAWCGPDRGWIEFDPTNDRQAGADHIVVARGRDYSDVAPVRGALRLSGGQKSHQAVDVVPVPA